jgi:protocatechuate 3,4-dioxygenase beta subunit
MKNKNYINRRKLLGMGLLVAGGLVSTASVQGLCDLKNTPSQPEGPFYPIAYQLDKDTDLTYVQGRSEQALGDVILVSGQVLDQNCNPVKDALVEIWQACQTGKYNHPSDPNTAKLDPNFQYWGRAITIDSGHYKFKTILPGAYPAGNNWIRPPHIHFKVQKLGYIELITQLYFQGEVLNDQDLILNRISPSERKQVVVPLLDVVGEQHPVANFNITLEKI